MLKLAIEKREAKASSATGGAQTAGSKTTKIKAVFYGPKVASTSIFVNESDFIKVFREAGESTVVTLTGGTEEHDTLIHDVKRDPVSDRVIHIDFYVMEKGKKVEVSVPLDFTGEAPAVKLGGNLIKVLHEIEIEAFPKDLPHSIEVDVSSIVDFDTQIKVGDLKLPAGVTAKTDADEVVALAAAAKEEVEEVAAPIDMSAIEISEKKGKKEEEEIPAE